MKYSQLGEKISSHSGIMQLMDDLGKAMTLSPHMRMLGGGNPAAIPDVQSLWRDRVHEGIADGSFDRMLVNYDPPRGNPRFLSALAKYLRATCGWNVDERNLAVTPGGQTAFFLLFNLLAGKMQDGSFRQVLLPVSPEYIGYCNQGLHESMLVSCPAQIELIGSHEFKYRVDFSAVERAIAEHDIGAICVSRPTNPSGNVLTTDEMSRLRTLASKLNVPLIVDNAYGQPFPGVIFSESTLDWDENSVFTLSLSKLGLPGTRTGIVVANEEIATRISQTVGVLGLANTNLGQWLVTPMLEDGSLDEICRGVVQPFYLNRSKYAREEVTRTFADRFPYRVHSSEGAFFLWIAFEQLQVSTMELYEELKSRDVIVVPGEYFFFGFKQYWEHQRHCIRVSFAQSHQVLANGIAVIADVVESRINGTGSGPNSIQH